MLSDKVILSRISQIIREYNELADKSIRCSRLSADDHFCDDLGGESMDLIAIILSLEEVFQISIREDELVDADPWRVGNLVTFIQRKMQESPVG